MDESGKERTYPKTRITFELSGHGRTTDGNSNDDDDHGDERDGAGLAELLNVAVERKWVRDGQGEEGDAELSIGEKGTGERWKDHLDNMGDGIADDYAKGAHTAKAERELKDGNSCFSVLTKAMLHDLDVSDATAEFGVEYDETNGPICEKREADEQPESSYEPRLAH